MLDHLAPGDVLTVTRIDRLAHSTFDLFAIVKQIVDAGAQFRSLAEPWADTGTSTGRLMIAVLGGLADVERDLIRTRTAEGRSRAKAQGQHMGRPPALTPSQRKEATRRRAEGATLEELAASYNVGEATIRNAHRMSSTTATRSSKVRTCWAEILGGCDGPLTGEHLFSKGLFSGKSVQVQGGIWKTTKLKSIGINSLTANILCRAHNNALSIVDAEGIRAFRSIRRFEKILSFRQPRFDAADLQHYADGFLLERWFLKHAINLFIASRLTKRWRGGSVPSKPPQQLVEAAFGLVRLQRPSGLYHWAGNRLGEQRIIGDQIEFQSYFDQADEFCGAHFVFQALQFLIWFDAAAPRADIAGIPLSELYHHFGGIFQAPPLAASFRINWS
jgi:hypothetical protein